VIPASRVCALLAVLAPVLAAADRYWGGGAGDIVDGTPLAPGAGDWSTTLANWADDPLGSDYEDWVNGDRAIFLTPGGNYTVTLLEDLGTAGIELAGPAPATVSLSGASGSPREVVGLAAGSAFAVTADAVLSFGGGGSETQLSIAGDLHKTGAGRVEFTRFFNNLTLPPGNTLHLEAGEFRYGGNRTFNAVGATVDIAAGATLDDRVSAGGSGDFVGGQKSIGALTGTGTYLGRTSPADDLKSNAILEIGGGDLSSSFDGLFVDGDPSRPLALRKLGTGEFTFNGTATIGGPLFVDAGTLRYNGDGSGSPGPLTVAAGATLAGDGQLGGTLEVQAGATLAPGDAIGALSVADTSTVAGSFECEIDGAAHDRLDSGGDLDLAGATLLVIESGVGATEQEYLIASYAGTLGSGFASVTLPDGYALDDSTPGEIRLVALPPPPPATFAEWATREGLDGSPGKEDGPDDNPDGDPFDNGLEWILGGSALTPDASGDLLQASADAGAGLVLSFERDDASEDEFALEANYSGDLFASDDHSAAIGAFDSGPTSDGVSVTVVEIGDAPDSVSVAIPASNASPEGSLFGRLRRVPPPADPDSIGVPGNLAGEVTEFDAESDFREGSFADRYTLTGASVGQTVRIELSSTDFDTYLLLIDADTDQVLDFNDDVDPPSDLNSALEFEVVAGVNYRIEATSAFAGATGAYTLSTSVLP